jgi:hypothetical protein
MITKVKILSFMTKINEIFNKRGGFSNEGMKLINNKLSKGMGGGSYGAHYRSKRNIFFVYFGFPIDPVGLGVMRNEMLLDGRIHIRRFYGFSDQVGYGVNRVFSDRFISRVRKKV